MIGFPSETEEEAMTTLDFIQSIKWLHFPLLHVLKIFPNTDMANLAILHGISEECIQKSSHLAYHDIAETLPYSKSFAKGLQSQFLSGYFLLSERLQSVIPIQKQILSHKEIVEKYNSFLPGGLDSYSEISALLGTEDIHVGGLVSQKSVGIIKTSFSKPLDSGSKSGLRVLLLDLSQCFSCDSAGHVVSNMIEAPLGLMYLLTYLNQELGAKINGKILKSMIDFDSFE
ncbi:MAG: B12-binding domain-containing radical SAM protein, partial [Planctomycetota bacterium]